MMFPKMPLVTINILNWNRKEVLKKTLTEIQKVNYPNIEVIVVDNASTDGSDDMVREEYPYVKVLETAENIGIGAWNLGFKNANGKYIVVLDDDSFPAPNAITSAVLEMEKDSSIGIIAGKVVNYCNGTPHRFSEQYKNGQRVYTFIGCGAIIRSDVIEKVGGFWQDLFLYAHEIEFSIRAIEAGYKVIYHADSLFYHMYSPKNRTSKRRVMFSTRNYIWIMWKYYPSVIEKLFVYFIRNAYGFRNELGSFLKGYTLGILGLHRYDRNVVKKSNDVLLRVFEDVSLNGIISKVKRKKRGSNSDCGL